MNRILSSLKRLEYLPGLISFAFRHDRKMIIYLLVSLLIPMIDVYSMSWLLPFASSVGNTPVEMPWYNLFFIDLLHVSKSSINYILIFLSLSFLRVILTLFSNYLILEITKHVQKLLSTRIFSEVLLRTKLKEIEAKSIGYFISLAGDQSSKSANVLMLIFSNVAILLNAALYYIYLYKVSPITLYFLSLFMILSTFFMYQIYLRIYRLGVKSLNLSRLASSTFLDGLNNLRTVRSFQSERYIANLYEKQLKDYLQNLNVYEFLSSSGKLLPLLILITISFVAVKFMSHDIGQTNFLADLAVIFAISLRLLMLIGQAATTMSRLVGEAYSCEDVVSWIRKFKLDQASNTDGTIEKLEHIHSISISGLKFSHTDQLKPTLKIKEINFERGKRYAIVGASGSGKSTLLDLVAGFYDNYSGEIKVDGTSLKDYPEDFLKKKITLLNQSPGIFNASIRDNILLGHPPETAETLEDACRKAKIWEHIQSLDTGFDSVINYQGTDFSGGQRQRISLARIFARNPDVVLLDEATSALDSATAEAVMENISRFCSDKILIFVTHSLEHLKFADHVIDVSQPSTN